MWPFVPKNPAPEAVERWIEKRKFGKLGRLLGRSDDPESCLRVVAMLGSAADDLSEWERSEASRAIAVATRHRAPSVRLAAIDQLVAIGDSHVAIYLHPLIEDPSEEVRALAVEAVCKKRHYGSMIAALSSSNETGRHAIVEALIDELRGDAEYIHTLDCWMAGRPSPDGYERPSSSTFDDRNLPLVKQDAEMSLVLALGETMSHLMDAKADVGLKIAQAFGEDPIKSFVRGAGADAEGSEPR